MCEVHYVNERAHGSDVRVHYVNVNVHGGDVREGREVLVRSLTPVGLCCTPTEMASDNSITI